MRSKRRFAALTWVLAVVTLFLALPSVAVGRPIMPDPYEVAKSVAESNLMDARSGWLRPSPAYSGSWVRDSFWTSGFLGPDVGRRALSYFGAHITPEGQVPTKLDSPNGPPTYYDDESALIYVIWAYRDDARSLDRVASAWKWIRERTDESGLYWTPGGTFHTWHDTLLFAGRDVASYNQGLYAVAAMAAVKLGIADPIEADVAARAYRALYRRDYGYVPASLFLDYKDASVLTGEFLARTLFRQSILTDSMVVSTVRSLPRAGVGFRTLAAQSGDYLDPSAFFITIAEGSYQNGGSWLLYDTMAWATAWMAGADEARMMPTRRMLTETQDGTLYEYLPTGPAIGNVTLHGNYGWNSYAWFALGARQGESEPFNPTSIYHDTARVSPNRLQ